LTWLAAPLLVFAAVFAALTAGNPSAATQDVGATASDASRPLPAPGDTRAALDRLRDAVRAEADPRGYAALGDAYYQRVRETGNSRLYDRADQAYEAALASDADNVTALSGLATISLARHQFADGLVLARRAHRAEPSLVAPYAALVDALIENGRYARAARKLERMLRLKPTLAAYSRVSYYRELHGDLRGAARALAAAVSAGSGTIEGSAYIRSLSADLAATRGRYGAAERGYRAALAVDPEYGRAIIGLALLQAGRGELVPAIATLREQLSDPPSPDELVQLGELEQAAGRLAAARRHYAQASELEREGLKEGSGYDAGVTLNEAEHGDPTVAVGYGRRAWRSAPSVSSADAYSWALYRAGRIEAATRLSAESMRLGSRDPEFRYHAGMIAKAAGDEERATRHLSTLLEQSPRFNPLYAPRAIRALERLRDTEERIPSRNLLGFK
jgi:tetratricopeptide (TPR) repeat protein